jgi:hypothetical protein
MTSLDGGNNYGGGGENCLERDATSDSGGNYLEKDRGKEQRRRD